MENTSQEPNVREYLDYRKYLKDFFVYKKAKIETYSYRVFARKAGISSPGHLKMVMDGKRNLTHDMTKKYKAAIGFEKSRDSVFFDLLVNYEQESDHDKKMTIFQKILSEKKKKGYSYLAKEQFDFLTKWYYVAIYVLVEDENFSTDAAWIQAKLKRKVAKDHIEKAINDLIKLEMLEFDTDHGLRQTNGALDTPEEVLRAATDPYHKNMINLGLDYLDDGDYRLREFNGATIPINDKVLKILKEKIREFRKEVNDLTQELENVSDVYQFNIQLFPLTVREL